MSKKSKQGKLPNPEHEPWGDWRRGFLRSEDIERSKREGWNIENDVIWMNDVYQVNVRRLPAPPIVVNGMPAGDVFHLSVKRRDKRLIRDWRHLQRIKNELTAPEAEAVELYPAESRLVDTANQYHLWVIDGVRWPFGYQERLVEGRSLGGTRQREHQKVLAVPPMTETELRARLFRLCGVADGD
jgi:hypothetical protein